MHLLVPAAGSGTRAGGDLPKQYRLLAGKPLLEHTLGALGQVPGLQQRLVVLARDDSVGPALAKRCGFEPAPVGGPTRAASVLAGLAELQRRGARPRDWVLVHDAARCCVQPAWVERLIDACGDDPVGGLLAVPLADTLKSADADGRSRATLERAGKWLAQTPQMFRLGMLREALECAARAGAGVTDEAGAIEQAGHAPRLVAGDSANLKVTYAFDFFLAEAILSARGPSESWE
jgi:2-C-methyl-D-erythritol 4-phosphate cytidylyltransferase